jgi:hypothetical protein
MGDREDSTVGIEGCIEDLRVERGPRLWGGEIARALMLAFWGFRAGWLRAWKGMWVEDGRFIWHWQFEKIIVCD